MLLLDTLLQLLLVAIFAQLVNSSMGMGYGVITTTLLLGLGAPPAQASATVHMAQIGTTAVSGTAHWRLGNLDRKLVLALALPGAVGAFLGAVLVAVVPVDVARPVVTVFLFTLGSVILLRFAGKNARVPVVRGLASRTARPLGMVAGFFDASGGGGWGPINMSVLMAKLPVEPRKVVGSVNASELLVTIAATAGFVVALGWSDFPLTWVGALMLGGIVAAPIGAWFSRHIPPHLLGVLVGALILVTNTRTFAVSLGASTMTVFVAAAVVGVLAGLVVLWVAFRHRAVAAVGVASSEG